MPGSVYFKALMRSSILQPMQGLSKITITQFKNYDVDTFRFTERVVGICGLNGKGKTNLLDAVYYCCFTKSYFTKTDAHNTQFGKEGFRLDGIASFGKDNDYRIVCIYRGIGKKEFYLNDVAYNKFSEHIGKFPAVMIAPDDVELVTGSSEERRRYMDTVLSQTDAAYLQQLIQYNKVLQQRNSLLKRFADHGKTDWSLLEVLDDQLVQPGNYIHAKRKLFTEQLIPLVQNFYHQISNNNETVTLQYESQLNSTLFPDLLNQVREKDFYLQRSNGGTHKDELEIQLNGKVFKNIASQGQRKSLLFAMKLAEFEIIRLNKGFAPVLLLDDVFEKLDSQRMQHLLNWVCCQNQGQVFITDTHEERLKEAFENLNIAYQLIKL